MPNSYCECGKLKTYGCKSCHKCNSKDKRIFNHDAAIILHEDGYTDSYIATLYKVSRERIRQITLNIPVLSNVRRCVKCYVIIFSGKKCIGCTKSNYCIKCHKKINSKHTYCQKCFGLSKRTVDRDIVVKLWGEKVSLKDMSIQLNTTVNSMGVIVTRMRRDGYNLPYRHKPH